METHLRLATGNEASLVYQMMDDYYHEVQSPFHPKKHRWALERLIGNPAVGRLWLVLVGQEVVGYVVLTLGYCLEMGALDAFLDDVYVVPRARGRGLGKAALQMAMGEAARLGAQVVHLEVAKQNERARNLYRRLGFKDRDNERLMTCCLIPQES